jgi:hypothetical protein
MRMHVHVWFAVLYREKILVNGTMMGTQPSEGLRLKYRQMSSAFMLETKKIIHLLPHTRYAQTRTRSHLFGHVQSWIAVGARSCINVFHLAKVKLFLSLPKATLPCLTEHGTDPLTNYTVVQADLTQTFIIPVSAIHSCALMAPFDSIDRVNVAEHEKKDDQPAAHAHAASSNAKKRKTSATKSKRNQMQGPLIVPKHTIYWLMIPFGGNHSVHV